MNSEERKAVRGKVEAVIANEAGQGRVRPARPRPERPRPDRPAPAHVEREAPRREPAVLVPTALLAEITQALTEAEEELEVVTTGVPMLEHLELQDEVKVLRDRLEHGVARARAEIEEIITEKTKKFMDPVFVEGEKVHRLRGEVLQRERNVKKREDEAGAEAAAARAEVGALQAVVARLQAEVSRLEREAKAKK